MIYFDTLEEEELLSQTPRTSRHPKPTPRDFQTKPTPRDGRYSSRDVKYTARDARHTPRNFHRDVSPRGTDGLSPRENGHPPSRGQHIPRPPATPRYVKLIPKCL